MRRPHWLPAEIARDSRGYVLTGVDVVKSGRWSRDRDPYLLETSVPGIFACGDVRFSPVKRVASAVGEGSMAIAFVHQYLREQVDGPLGLLLRKETRNVGAGLDGQLDERECACECFCRCCGLLYAGAILALAGCGDHYPINPPLKTWDPNAGYRLERLKDDASAGSLLVVLMFSGGGTRAATLSYGTLEALRDVWITIEGRKRRLLDEVDVIIGISGGSITAAYYGLFHERIFTDFEPRFLRRDVQGELKTRLATNLHRVVVIEVRTRGSSSPSISTRKYSRARRSISWRNVRGHSC